FRVDPTIIRVIFVGLLLLSKGGFALVYIVLAFVLPEANTSEERAAAHGEPFNARELIDRARKQYAGKSRDWSRAWRRDMRAARRGGGAAGAGASGSGSGAAASTPGAGAARSARRRRRATRRASWPA